MVAIGDLLGAVAIREFETELVDFSGKTVDVGKLLADLEKLELAISKEVFWLNTTPYVLDQDFIKWTKRARKEIDRWADEEWPWGDG